LEETDAEPSLPKGLTVFGFRRASTMTKVAL